MYRPTILLMMLISTHFRQIVQSEKCTEEEGNKLTEMQAEVNKFQSNTECVDMETLAYDCTDSCVEIYQTLYKGLPECAFPSESFGYVNLKELYHAFEHLCQEDAGNGNASTLAGLEGNWHDLIFPTHGSVSSNLNEHRVLQAVAPATPKELQIPEASSLADLTTAAASAIAMSEASSMSRTFSDDSKASKDDSLFTLPGLDSHSSWRSFDDSDGSSQGGHAPALYHESADGPNVLAIVLPLAIFAVIAGAMWMWCMHQRKSAMAEAYAEDAYRRHEANRVPETGTATTATTEAETEAHAVPLAQPLPSAPYLSLSQLQPLSHAQSPSNDAGVYDIWSDRELVERKLNYTDIQDIKILGSGAFGVVWLVSYYDNYYASKRLARNVADPSAFETFVDEVKLVARIEHANIVDCIGVAWTMRSNFQALFTYMPNGDLREYLQRPNVPRHWTKEKLSIAIDIAEALVYVQSFERPIVHRDLKSRNVLLSEEMIAKVSDFGSARLMSDNNTMTTQAVGTARWLAPEVVAGESYDHTCDSYSFGAILTELDTNELPLHDAVDQEGKILPDYALLHRVACRMIKPSVSEDCPQEMRDLVDKCLNFEPRERPTAVQISFELRRMLKDGSVVDN